MMQMIFIYKKVVKIFILGMIYKSVHIDDIQLED